MRGEQHAIIGALGTYLVMFVLGGFQFMPATDVFIYAIAAAVLGSLLPDILEPAKHWTHRKNLHSYDTMVLLGKATGIIFIPTAILSVVFGFNYLIPVFAVPFGYFLHLVADSTTKMGLPRKNGAWHFLGMGG